MADTLAAAAAATASPPSSRPPRPRRPASDRHEQHVPASHSQQGPQPPRTHTQPPPPRAPPPPPSSTTSISSSSRAADKISMSLRPAEFDNASAAAGRSDDDHDHDHEPGADDGAGSGSSTSTSLSAGTHRTSTRAHRPDHSIGSAAAATAALDAPHRPRTRPSVYGPDATSGGVRRVRRPLDEEQYAPEIALDSGRREPAAVQGHGLVLGHARHGSSSSHSSSINTPASMSGPGYPPVQGVNMNGRDGGQVEEQNGSPYYRRHVHEYDRLRHPGYAQGYGYKPIDGYGHAGEFPPSNGSMEPSTSRIDPHSPSYSPSSLASPAVIPPPMHMQPHPMHSAPSQFHSSIGSFATIQNLPKTPHELLGLPPGAPLNLWSLPDAEKPDEKPKYNYHVLVKLAILGNKGEKATLQEILRAIRLRFSYYANLDKQDSTAFSNSIRHLLSLLAAFVREPKPVTEPGKGAYWRVDFSRGEGNKRIRKRNKRKKDDAESPDSPSGPQTERAKKQKNKNNGDTFDEFSGEEEPPLSAIEGSERSGSGSVAATIEETVQKPAKAPRTRKAAPTKAKPAKKNGAKEAQAHVPVGNGSAPGAPSSTSTAAAAARPSATSAARPNADPVIDPALFDSPNTDVALPQRNARSGVKRVPVARPKARTAAKPYPPAPPPAINEVIPPGHSPAMTSSDLVPTPMTPAIALAHSHSQHSQHSQYSHASDHGSPAHGQLHLNGMHISSFASSSHSHHSHPHSSQTQSQSQSQSQHHRHQQHQLFSPPGHQTHLSPPPSQPPYQATAPAATGAFEPYAGASAGSSVTTTTNGIRPFQQLPQQQRPTQTQATQTQFLMYSPPGHTFHEAPLAPTYPYAHPQGSPPATYADGVAQREGGGRR